MKVCTENNNNFGFEKNTIVVDNTPLSQYELQKETHRAILKPPADIIQHTYLVV
jgi:hypothetical protein